MTNKICDMYPTDEASYKAAMDHFDGEGAPAELPVMYPTDDAAHEAALRHFEKKDLSHDD